MNEIVYPNYENSILNIMASIQKHYNVETNNKSLNILDNVLTKKYKNVILMVFDGMGVDMLEKNLSKDDFLRKNILANITSVYPSTTASAMTTYYSGLTPNEHGWLGWFLYFKEFCRCIDVFTNYDSFSGEFIERPHAGFTLMPYTTIYEKINMSKCYTIAPFDMDASGKSFIHTKVSSTDDLCLKIKELSEDEDNKFIFSYWHEPDNTMHESGCYAEKTKELIKSFNNQIQNMCNELDNTLIIISADHGHIDISEIIYLNEIKEIDECLIMPPSVEKRAVSFFVKPEMKELFKQRFEKKFSNDFILFTKEEVFEKNLLGYGISHTKTKDFIGDFFACGISDKMLYYKALNSKEIKNFLSSHAGLTKKEMIVPLIVIER